MKESEYIQWPYNASRVHKKAEINIIEEREGGEDTKHTHAHLSKQNQQSERPRPLEQSDQTRTESVAGRFVFRYLHILLDGPY